MSDYLDGNVLGGPMAEMFVMDITTAVAQCASCGTAAMMAEARVYPNAPGMVARCAACDEVLLRVVHGPGRAWLDMRGMTSLEWAMPAADAGS